MSGNEREKDIISAGTELALSHFRSGKYRDALKVYNKVLTIIKSRTEQDIIQARVDNGLSPRPVVGPLIHPKLAAVVDQRAATYDKLNLLDKALEDAKRLIAYEPVGSKGYLRTGKLLLSMKKDYEAYKVYREGVSLISKAIAEHHISVSIKLFDNLKYQYKTLSDKFKKEKESRQTLNKPNNVGQRLTKSFTEQKYKVSTGSQRTVQSILPIKRTASEPILIHPKKIHLITFDPLDHFPMELIFEIFEQLSFSDVLRCLMVSKRWFELLTSLPSLFQFIRFRNRATLQEFAMGMKRLTKAHKRSPFKQVRMFKLKPKSTDEKACLIYMFHRVALNYQGLELVLSEFTLYDFIKMVVREESGLQNIRETKRFRLSLKLITGLESNLLEMMPNLQTLELIPNDIAVLNPNIHHELPKTISSSLNYPNLENLSILGNPKFDKNKVVPFTEGFSLNKFPNLRSLTIVGYDLTQFITTPTFSKMFDNLPNLKNLVLENNKGLDWEIFLNVFQFSNCVLDSLLLRQDNIQSPTHLRPFQLDNLVPLSQLRSLDIYSSSLSFEGLMKLLSCCKDTLKTLFMGNCQYFVFKTGRLGNFRGVRGGVFELSQFFKMIPNVEKLYLSESNIDDFTLKEFYTTLKSLKFKTNLKLLDIGFCQFQGIGLIDLFGVSKRYTPTFVLDTLVIDGCEVSPGTLKLLEGDYVKQIQNEMRPRWRVYGLNSFLPSI